jgi:hypothetical protein
MPGTRPNMGIPSSSVGPSGLTGTTFALRYLGHLRMRTEKSKAGLEVAISKGNFSVTLLKRGYNNQQLGLIRQECSKTV